MLTWTAGVSPGGIWAWVSGLGKEGVEWEGSRLAGQEHHPPEPWGGCGLSLLLAAGGLLVGSAGSLGPAEAGTVALQQGTGHTAPKSKLQSR